MKKKFKSFESLEFQDDGIFKYNDYYTERYNAFRLELLEEMRVDLIGKTIYLRGKKRSNPDDHIKVNGYKIKPIYKILVKNVVFSGDSFGDVKCMDVIDENDERYRLWKLVNESVYYEFKEKLEREFKREKDKKSRHIIEDPYDEENWD